MGFVIHSILTKSMLTAIILKREDIRENDQRITLYTKERGLVIARVVGVKKIQSKQSPRLEQGVLAYVQLVRGRAGEKITTSEPLSMYSQMRSSYKKSLCVQYILGLIAQTVKPGQPDPALFEFLKTVLEVYNKMSEDRVSEVLRRALWKYLEILGYRNTPRGDLKDWQEFAQHHLEHEISSPVLLYCCF